MNRFFIISIFLSIFTLFNAQAAIYKGQREFVKNCVGCHKSGQEFVARKKKIEWEKFLHHKGEKLADIHLKSLKAQESHTYFNSREFYNKTKHLEQFLLEYAKDSGNIPACN